MRRKSDNLRARGFTLIEILIVVVILGILGAIVLPRFSNASQLARTNTLKDDLRYLRTQLVVFKAQHRDVAPGYANGNVNTSPTEKAFTQQMTGTTNEFCAVGSASSQYRFGPYLTRMPPNPINNLTTVKMVANGQPMPTPDGSTGWIYKPSTVEIIPNLSGTDTDGIRYTDY